MPRLALGLLSLEGEQRYGSQYLDRDEEDVESDEAFEAGGHWRPPCSDRPIIGFNRKRVKALLRAMTRKMRAAVGEVPAELGLAIWACAWACGVEICRSHENGQKFAQRTQKAQALGKPHRYSGA